MQLLVIGDIHGCLNQLQELLKNVDRTTTRVILCGNLIDRGPNSREVINYVRDNNIESVLGNHELMFIECRKHIELLANGMELTPRFTYELKSSDWFYSGGDDVFKSYNGDYKAMLADIDYLTTLPTYIRTGINTASGKEIVVSHTMVLDYIDNDCVAAQSTGTLVWNRTQLPRNEEQKFFNMHGHTPVDYVYAIETTQQGKPLPMVNKSNTAINLDTGATYNSPLRGYLSGVFMPSGDMLQVKTFKD